MNHSGEKGSDPPIVLLIGDRSDVTRCVFHALDDDLAGDASLVALLEASASRVTLARRRARRLGWTTAAGQVAFVLGVMPVLRWRGRSRVRKIALDHALDFSPIAPVTDIESVNDNQTIELIRALNPVVIVVQGTRIISKAVLDEVRVPVVNLHAGITPRYRGVHGGYWALREGRPELAGTTVHLIDAGVDTGGILGQATYVAAPEDSIATYPYLHAACGLPLLKRCVRQALAGSAPALIGPLAGAEVSRLRWHPTAWDYLRARRRDRIR